MGGSTTICNGPSCVYLSARGFLCSSLNVLRKICPKCSLDNSTVARFISPMPEFTVPEKFLVAFSFAGEQREFVRAVAQTVENELGSSTVFLDEWYEFYLAGASADLKLQSIYLERVVLVVVCVSKPYGDKPWSQVEHEAIRARLMRSRGPTSDKRERDAIFPIRVGDGEIEGIPFNSIVPDKRSRTVNQAAAIIIQRLRLVVPALSAGSRQAPTKYVWPEAPTSLFWPTANHTDIQEAFGTTRSGYVLANSPRPRSQ